MSCCGGNCGCGSGCNCGNGCSGCKMYPDLMEQSTTSETMILGVTAEKKSFSRFEMVAGFEENDCKCGPNCTCGNCTCK